MNTDKLLLTVRRDYTINVTANIRVTIFKGVVSTAGDIGQLSKVWL